MRRARTISLALIFLAGPLCHARDLAVIVNKSNATSKLSATDLERLLKAGVPTWPDGKKIKIFLADPGSSDLRQIVERACKMKSDELKSVIAAHKAEIQVVGSDEIVLTMVDQNPGAIGIVNVYSINSRVKVLKVDEKLPMEQGYLLHGN